MPRCAGITRSGDQCSATVPPGATWCYNHDPEHAAQRQRNASKAGKARGNREVLALKTEVKGIISEIHSGALPHVRGQVVLQGYRVLRDYIDLERRIVETDELVARLEALEDVYGEH